MFSYNYIIIFFYYIQDNYYCVIHIFIITIKKLKYKNDGLLARIKMKRKKNAYTSQINSRFFFCCCIFGSILTSIILSLMLKKSLIQRPAFLICTNCSVLRNHCNHLRLKCIASDVVVGNHCT